MIVAEQRWHVLMAYRPRLLALAARMGAGADTEDVVQDALLRTAAFPGLMEERAWPFLATVTARLVVDHHRRTANDQVLRRHAALMPRPCGFEDAVADWDEGRRAETLIARLAPRIRHLIRLRMDGATWAQIGVSHGESAAAVEMRYRRALAPVRRALRPRDRNSATNSVELAVQRRTTSEQSPFTRPEMRFPVNRGKGGR
ncbi:sigma-70 family RNA polymerase sigma factor, partial [Nonomuraea sp. RK-328]|nr:sigma-70 family RNA polymerase sigma factor [Nonomuraea sp. RK-328]